MKYCNIIKRNNNKKLLQDLCELYVVCDCLEEFLIKANLICGKIPWTLLTSFKLFYVKKSKPWLYYGLKISYYILLACFLKVTSCPPIIILFFPLSEFIFWHMFGDNMYTIEWYDNGRPFDYI